MSEENKFPLPAESEDIQSNAPQPAPQATPQQGSFAQTQESFAQPPPSAPVPPVNAYAMPTAAYEMPSCGWQPQDTRPVRRVGTVTSGLALIFAGVLICLSIFQKDQEVLLNLVRFTPVLLIVLGIEILMSRIGSEKVRIKYDFLSVLLVFFVLCFSVAAACVPYAMAYYSPEREAHERTLVAQWEENLYAQLKEEKAVDRVYVNLHLDNYTQEVTGKTLENLGGVDYARVEIVLQGDYADATAFAQACAPVVAGVLAAGPVPTEITLETINDTEAASYTLSLEGPYRQNKTPEEWASLVETEYYIKEYNEYVDAQRKEDYEQQRARDALDVPTSTSENTITAASGTQAPSDDTNSSAFFSATRNTTS